MGYSEFDLYTKAVYMPIQCNKFCTYFHWNLINIISFFARSQSGA